MRKGIALASLVAVLAACGTKNPPVVAPIPAPVFPKENAEDIIGTNDSFKIGSLKFLNENPVDRRLIEMAFAEGYSENNIEFVLRLGLMSRYNYWHEIVREAAANNLSNTLRNATEQEAEYFRLLAGLKGGVKNYMGILP